ncbi:MAG: zf-HC2 domain-containing protein [Acidimicrobiales bacterium]
MTVAPLTCFDFVELVTEYLEGTLSAKDRRRFEEHLAACPGCTAYLKQIRETIRAVGSVTEDDLSAPTRVALLDAFRDWNSTEHGSTGLPAERGFVARLRSWPRRAKRGRPRR